MEFTVSEILASISPLIGKWEYAEPLYEAVRSGQVRPDTLERLGTLIRDASVRMEADRKEIETVLALETAKSAKRSEESEKASERLTVAELL